MLNEITEKEIIQMMLKLKKIIDYSVCSVVVFYTNGTINRRK
jgi:hypothetical protein